MWHTPLGGVDVDAELAASLCGKGGFAPDLHSHLGEHSIEVLLPFLQCVPPQGLPGATRRITPVCVGTMQHKILQDAGLALAEVIRQYENRGERIGIIVSSDMNHYEDQETTMRKDAFALSQALACDPEGLLSMGRSSRSVQAMEAAVSLNSPARPMVM